MNRRTALVGAASLAFLPGGLDAAEERAHDFGFTSIEGDPLPMASFAGRAVLVVNTASRCGFTHQYEGLQALHERYRERGFAVLGVPSNDFRQELESAEEVRQFCELTYGIDFPMTEIERVQGEAAHPLFRWMADRGAEPRWNFTKFLIGPDGRFVESFATAVPPDDPRIAARIEDVLGSG